MMKIFDRGRTVPILLTLVVGCGGGMPASKEAEATGMSFHGGAPMAPAAVMAPPPPAPPAGPGRSRAADISGLTLGLRGGEGAKQGPGGGKAAPDPQPPTSSNPVQKQQSIIIYSAEINMTVFEVENSMKKIEELAKTIGGFMAKREDKTIVIRVPAEKFDEALHAVEKLGDVSHRNIMAEDVTEEFRDLEVRLKGSKAVQERLTQLLAKASKVEESIAIERELDRVTMEIDRIEGRMKFLRDRAAFSTLTITFQPKTTENVNKNGFHLPTPWLSELGLGRLLRL